MKRRILLADDETDQIALVAPRLTEQGYEVHIAGDGAAVLSIARDVDFHLIILDLMHQEPSGFDICKALRNDPLTHRIQIILLTAKAEEVDRILGFELGADDFISKPFSVRELLLRVGRSLACRPAAETLTFGLIHLDSDRREVTVEGLPIHVTKIEFGFLKALLKRPGKIITRKQLIDQVWDEDRDVHVRTIDTHMSRLRRKLGVAGGHIEAVPGEGYRLQKMTPSQL